MSAVDWSLHRYVLHSQSAQVRPARALPERVATRPAQMARACSEAGPPASSTRALSCSRQESDWRRYHRDHHLEYLGRSMTRGASLTFNHGETLAFGLLTLPVALLVHSPWILLSARRGSAFGAPSAGCPATSYALVASLHLAAVSAAVGVHNWAHSRFHGYPPPSWCRAPSVPCPRQAVALLHEHHRLHHEDVNVNYCTVLLGFDWLAGTTPHACIHTGSLSCIHRCCSASTGWPARRRGRRTSRRGWTTAWSSARGAAFGRTPRAPSARWARGGNRAARRCWYDDAVRFGGRSAPRARQSSETGGALARGPYPGRRSGPSLQQSRSPHVVSRSLVSLDPATAERVVSS